MIVIVICLPKEYLGVHENSLKRIRAFQIELEFKSVGFLRRREKPAGLSPEKPLGARERTNKKLNPHVVWKLGFEPVPHWWEASALTSADTLTLLAPTVRLYCNYPPCVCKDPLDFLTDIENLLTSFKL